MPSRPYDPTKPTVYADTSTLCDAHLAANGRNGGSPEYATLGPWVEGVAKDANLCLSLVHIGELSKWMRTNEAEHLAKWLDSLPVVWTKSITLTQMEEVEHWVRVAVGSTPGSRYFPFASSFASAMADMNLGTTVDLFRDPRLPRLLRDSRRVDWEKYRHAGFEWAKKFRDDRADMRAEGATKEQLDQRTEVKRDGLLRSLASEAHQRLRGKEGYRPGLEVREIQDRFVEVFRKDPRAVPSLRIGFAYDREFIEGVEKRTEGSKKDLQQLPGTFGDRTHACVGAAYCDIFTCDRSTLEGIMEQRAALGFTHTFAPRLYTGGLPKYVADLTALF